MTVNHMQDLDFLAIQCATSEQGMKFRFGGSALDKILKYIKKITI